MFVTKVAISLVTPLIPIFISSKNNNEVRELKKTYSKIQHPKHNSMHNLDYSNVSLNFSLR
jgi:hypothetical protein